MGCQHAMLSYVFFYTAINIDEILTARHLHNWRLLPVNHLIVALTKMKQLILFSFYNKESFSNKELKSNRNRYFKIDIFNNYEEIFLSSIVNVNEKRFHIKNIFFFLGTPTTQDFVGSLGGFRTWENWWISIIRCQSFLPTKSISNILCDFFSPL